MGVGLHPGHRAELPEGLDEIGKGPVHWSTGQEPTAADAVVYAVGRVTPNTGWLPAELLDDEGFVLADRQLRVPGADGVFAIGDVAATDPQRSSARNFTYRLLAGNVRAHLAGGDLASFRLPRSRWGSIMGELRDGVVLYSPKGRPNKLPLLANRWLITPVFLRRMIYGGIRRRPNGAALELEGRAPGSSPRDPRK